MAGVGDKLPTNEDLVEDLVKNLDKSCDLVGEEEVKCKIEDDSVEPEALEPEDPDEPKPEDEQESLPDDYIDEVVLKDREVALSDEDKEKLKRESEELKNEGNALFKSGSYLESVDKYTLALRTCPLAYDKIRSVLYANRAAAKVHLNRKTLAIDDCTKALELDETYMKAYLRRASLYEETEKLDEALADYNKLLELDRTNIEALKASVRLPPLIEERNEKLKTEMMSKLKDLGNTILKPFGLSTNNFQMVQDPNSGGYSISFKS